MAKLKSGNAIVRLLLSHGEKLGMLAILVCAGMLFWSALGVEKLGDDQEPQDLVGLTTRANEQITKSTWDTVDPNNKVVAAPVSIGAMADIPADHFPTLDYPLSRPVLDPISLRKDPAILSVEDLEVYGDSGLWASAEESVIRSNQLRAMKEAQEKAKKAEAALERETRGRGPEGGEGRGSSLFGGSPRGGVEGGGRFDRETSRSRNDGPVIVTPNSRTSLQGFEEINEESWVTIVGRIPIEKQTKVYESALEDASGYDPGTDVPVYKGYEVERAEITHTGLGEWKTIARVNSRVLEKEISTYPFDAPDLISQRYTHPLLTHPLPPLVLRDWDRRVTHSEIPLIEEEEPEGFEDFEEGTMEEESDETDMFARRSNNFDEGGFGERSGRMTGRTGRRSTRGGRGGARGMPRGMPMRGMSEMMGGEFMGGGMERGGRGGMSRGRGSVADFVWDGQTSHVLFRYFDNSVKPGSRYRYRVRLAVADVNDEVDERYLDQTVLERRKQIKVASRKAYQFTEWSEPSPIASVPLPARVHVAGAEPIKQSSIDDEPEAVMLVKAFDSGLPAEFAKKESFLRGSVLNPLDEADVIWTQVSSTDGSEQPEELKEKFQFRTGVTVVDIRGGEKLSTKNRDLLHPASVLLMDPAGRLFVRVESEDAEPVQEFEDAKEGLTADGGRGGGFQGGFGGRGGPGGEFFGGEE